MKSGGGSKFGALARGYPAPAREHSPPAAGRARRALPGDPGGGGAPAVGRKHAWGSEKQRKTAQPDLTRSALSATSRTVIRL